MARKGNMTSRESYSPTIYLRSGEVYFTDQPTEVMIVLGSCVSVTLYHRRLGLSAVSHGLLPHCRERAVCAGNCAGFAKFVECSVRSMAGRFKQSGITLQELEARIYGGAEMFGERSSVGSSASVGKQNVETALKALNDEGLRVHAMDVGGSLGRKIFFDTGTGEVFLKHIHLRTVSPGSHGEAWIAGTVK